LTTSAYQIIHKDLKSEFWVCG